MNIFFIISSMDGGGAERVTALLCNHWVTEGHAVTLALTAAEQAESKYPLDPRVRLESLSEHVGGLRKTVFNKLRRLFALRLAIREYQPDVVVSFMYDVNVAAAIAKVGVRATFIASERVHPPLSQCPFLGRLIRRISYAGVSSLVVLTRETEEWMHALLRKGLIRVIPNPVIYPLPSTKSAVFSPEQYIVPGRRLLLACARLEEQKNLPLLLQAFAAIVAICPDWDLVVLGDGCEREALESLLVRLGLKGRVWLPGWASNLSDWYERADLFALSSKYEGFPNALIEAMSYGVPVISTNCPTGPSDIVRDGVDGVLVSLESGIEGFRDELLRLMTQDSLREDMAKAAVDVRERFSMQRIALMWDELLKSAVR